MKVGDTAYIVESNRYVREVEIRWCSGGMLLVQFTDTDGGIQVKAHRLFAEKSVDDLICGLRQIRESFDKYSENLIKSSTIGARKIAFRKESVAETREIPYNNAV